MWNYKKISSQPHTAPSQFREGSWLTNNNNGQAIYFLLISLVQPLVFREDPFLYNSSLRRQREVLPAGPLGRRMAERVRRLRPAAREALAVVALLVSGAHLAPAAPDV